MALIKNRRWIAGLCMLVTFGAMLIPAWWLFGKAVPRDRQQSYESVRLRNSLLASVGAAEDFSWTPAEIPKTFHWEKMTAPDKFRALTTELLANAGDRSNFEKILIFARHLRARESNNSAISVSTVMAYDKIVKEGVGWCSDFTQVLNGLGVE